MRAQGSTAKLVSVSISTSPFSKEPQYHPYVVIFLVHPSDDTILITRAALAGLRHIYRKGFQYHRGGVILREIGPREEVQQTDLFAPLPDPRRRKLMNVLDAVNREFGRGALRLGAEGLSQDWKMRQNLKSPCWTTRWDELLKAR